MLWVSLLASDLGYIGISFKSVDGEQRTRWGKQTPQEKSQVLEVENYYKLREIGGFFSCFGIKSKWKSSNKFSLFFCLLHPTTSPPPQHIHMYTYTYTQTRMCTQECRTKLVESKKKNGGIPNLKVVEDLLMDPKTSPKSSPGGNRTTTSPCLTGEMTECHSISVLRPKSVHAHNPADFNVAICSDL